MKFRRTRAGAPIFAGLVLLAGTVGLVVPRPAGASVEGWTMTHGCPLAKTAW